MNVLAINAMLQGPGLLAYLGEGARFLVCDAAKPAPGGSATTMLAAAVLASPAGVVVNGVLTLAQADAEGDMAAATGVATWGRLELADGTWVEDFTVSGPSGSGQVKIEVIDPPVGDPEAKLYQGGRFLLGGVTLG
ncbi:hypothetical protein QFZ83_003700 [Variovorax sp. W1I1]|uniref:hypothetical protein n=1 Tax=Variovorax sp. W1I1 TaxID=3042309 RepID=UPI002789CA50|nr:hypothetical protein [Variovorax sp. W1I1]MDQ0609529.1 hypothetical protein [Variovorax sp. W1I1]